MTIDYQNAVSLPEYDANPFIAALPPILSRREWIKVLQQAVVFSEFERDYPAKLRKHCVLRLGSYFEPTERQLKLAERVDMMMRRGYMGRNPLKPGHTARLAGGVRAAMTPEEEEASELMVLPSFESTALSNALIGCSGIGKTLAVVRVLGYYPQCIEHSGFACMTQITWLRLESPHTGGPKQLCIDFFKAVDRLLGTKYFQWYVKKGTAVDELIVHMAEVATLHAIGLLVVDEVQHLQQAKGQLGEEVLSFLVKLENQVGISVLMIGTPKAEPILTKNFRQGRRSSMLGGITWNQMPCDKTWEHFVGKLWKHQWTRQFTPLTTELCHTLHDLTQGITSLLVILFMLAQMRLITIAESRPDATEKLTCLLLKQVAKEEFAMIQPMLRALRRGDKKALTKYDDLQPLYAHIETVFQQVAAGNDAAFEGESLSSEDPAEALPPASPMPSDTQQRNDSLLVALTSIGVAHDVAAVLIAKVGPAAASASPAELLKMLAEEASGEHRAPKTPKARSQPQKKPAKSKAPAASPETVPAPPLPPDDLRAIILQGDHNAATAYEALKTAGVIKQFTPESVFL